jgi:hypothetical protein
MQTHLRDNEESAPIIHPHLKTFFRFLSNTEQFQGFPSLFNYLILPSDAIFPQVAVREQRQPFVPMAFLQICCDLHQNFVSSVTVQALASLTGSRRPNGLSGGSRNEGIVLLFELASQACGEGLGS